MFLDFRHLYYAAWHSPKTTSARFLTRAVTKWKHHALLMDLRWGLVRGSLPKCSLDSMWALVSLTVAGRSLRLRQEENMHKLLDAFWLSCGFTGPFHLGGLAMNSTDLTCCGSAAVHVEKGFVNGHEALQVLVPAEAGRLEFTRRLAKRWQRDVLSRISLSKLLLLLDRFTAAGSAVDVSITWRRSAQLAKACVQQMERFYRSDAARLSRELPKSAVTRYIVKNGKALTHEDPRAQVHGFSSNPAQLTS